MSATLKARAEREAAALIAEHGLDTGAVRYSLLVSLISLGWVHGWDAGFDEAASDAMAIAQRALHSVKS